MSVNEDWANNFAAFAESDPIIKAILPELETHGLRYVLNRVIDATEFFIETTDKANRVPALLEAITDLEYARDAVEIGV